MLKDVSFRVRVPELGPGALHLDLREMLGVCTQGVDWRGVRFFQFPVPFADLTIHHGEEISPVQARRLREALQYFGAQHVARKAGTA